MADYYPVLKRAISSLPSSSGEARRAVYERARAALLKQLQSYDPPLPPAEVTDQRLALEECIRRVESETAGAAFGLPADTPPPAGGGDVKIDPPAPRSEPPRTEAPRAEPPRVDVSRTEPARSEPRPEPPPAMSAPASPPPRAPVLPPAHLPVQLSTSGEGNVSPGFIARPPSESREGTSTSRAEPRFEAKPPVRNEPPAMATLPGSGNAPQPEPPAAPDPKVDISINAGINALSRTLKNAESLGQAASTATRKARESIENTEPTKPAPVQLPRIEPDFEAKARSEPRLPGSETVPPKPSMQPRPLPAGFPSDAGFSLDLPAPRRRLFNPAIIGGVIVGLVLLAAAAYAFTKRDVITAFLVGTGVDRPATATDVPATSTTEGLEPKILDRLPQDGSVATPVAEDALAVTTERVAGLDVEPGTPAPPAVDTPVATPIDTPVAETPVAETPVATTPDVVTPPATDAPTAEVPAVPLAPTTDVPAVTLPATDTAPAADATPAIIVAQRAILYEEPVPGSQGAKLDGQVLWTFVNEPGLPGEAPIPQVRATIEIPDRKLKMTLSFRKNSDPAFPASHVTEIKFDLPADFASGGIDTTPGLIMKQTEDARGDPLIGAVAKVADNLFWVALSGADPDRTRNLALMREREWVDVPIRYTNRRRAIITFEKGTPGAKAFDAAFAAWQ